MQGPFEYFRVISFVDNLISLMNKHAIGVSNFNYLLYILFFPPNERRHFPCFDSLLIISKHLSILRYAQWAKTLLLYEKYGDPKRGDPCQIWKAEYFQTTVKIALSKAYYLCSGNSQSLVLQHLQGNTKCSLSL